MIETEKEKNEKKERNEIIDGEEEVLSVVAKELDTKGVSKTYLSYIPSFVLTRGVDFLAFAIDALLLAYLLGPTALSVDSRISPVYYWIMLVMNIFGGLQVYLSRIFVENDKHKINSVFTLSFYLVIIFATLTTIISLNSTTLLCLLDSSICDTDYLLRLGHRYLQGLVWGFFPMFAIASLDYMVRIDGSKYLPVVAGISYIVCNIVLDFWLIGKFRYFGAGIATSISYWVNFLIMSIHFLKKTNTYKLVRFKLSDVSIKSVFCLSGPRLAHHIAKLINVICLTVLGFRNFGIVFGIVNHIYNKASDFFDIFVIGTSDASSPLIGVAYARNDNKTLREIFLAMHKFVLPIIGVLCLTAFIFPQAIPLVLNVHDYDEAFAPACRAMRILSFHYIIYGFYFIYTKYYQLTGYENAISVLNLLRPTLFIIPFYYILARYDSGNGFWWANVIKDSIALFILLILHIWQNKKLKREKLNNVRI